MRNQTQCAYCVRRAATAIEVDITLTQQRLRLTSTMKLRASWTGTAVTPVLAKHSKARSQTRTEGVHTTVGAFVGTTVAVVTAVLTGLRIAKTQARRAKLRCDFRCLASIAGRLKVRQGFQIRLHTLGADQWKCLQRRIEQQRLSSTCWGCWAPRQDKRTLSKGRRRAGRHDQPHPGSPQIE